MKRRAANPWTLGLGVLACSLVLNSGAVAQTLEEGRALAQQWCQSCHETGANGSATDAAPSFPSLANDDSYTDPRLRAWMMDPHPPMPNLDLTHREIENLLFYIKSLKTN